MGERVGIRQNGACETRFSTHIFSRFDEEASQRKRLLEVLVSAWPQLSKAVTSRECTEALATTSVLNLIDVMVALERETESAFEPSAQTGAAGSAADIDGIDADQQHDIPHVKIARH